MTFPDSQRVAEARPVSRPRCARRVPRSQSLDTGLRASAYIQLFGNVIFSRPAGRRRFKAQGLLEMARRSEAQNPIAVVRRVKRAARHASEDGRAVPMMEELRQVVYLTALTTLDGSPCAGESITSTSSTELNPTRRTRSHISRQECLQNVGAEKGPCNRLS